MKLIYRNKSIGQFNGAQVSSVFFPFFFLVVQVLWNMHNLHCMANCDGQFHPPLKMRQRKTPEHSKIWKYLHLKDMCVFYLICRVSGKELAKPDIVPLNVPEWKIQQLDKSNEWISEKREKWKEKKTHIHIEHEYGHQCSHHQQCWKIAYVIWIQDWIRYLFILKRNLHD